MYSPCSQQHLNFSKSMIGLDYLQGFFQPQLLMSCGSLWNISPKILNSFPVMRTRNFLKLDDELERNPSGNISLVPPRTCSQQWIATIIAMSLVSCEIKINPSPRWALPVPGTTWNSTLHFQGVTKSISARWLLGKKFPCWLCTLQDVEQKFSVQLILGHLSHHKISQCSQGGVPWQEFLSCSAWVRGLL